MNYYAGLDVSMKEASVAIVSEKERCSLIAPVLVKHFSLLHKKSEKKSLFEP